ncbi:DUF6734 family protein [Kordia algicida OT-1]|uniref:DUF6734 domain-containing protein n=1 Tax=Kordia algicida OT-1 TaxID=391587 RepID=A9DYI7_9FLAO|nr:DUF6734 family protein [Kordia algicida]EDP96138.1 hypothetical protein KAOT1_08213 [Kordia algicida OT-1]
MKIIQSFWTGNSEVIPSCGWFSEKYHLLGWILSVNQLCKYYDEVELVTDTYGYELLIEKLQLPYTKVHVVLDELNKYPSDLWALAKIKTYQIQKTPFLHVDGDVFIWEKFSDELMSSNLIAQNIETTSEYYRTMWADIRPHLTHLPTSMELFDQSVHNKAYNMGIFGGNNMDFMQKYCEASFSFVDKNKENLTKVNQFNFNIFFEQVLFFEMTKIEKQEVSTYIKEDIGDNQYTNFGNFEDVPHKRTYLHLLGDFKRQLVVCKKMESYVMKNYPAYYKRLEILLNKPKLSSYIPYDYTKATNEAIIKEFPNTFLKSAKMHDKPSFLIARDLYMSGQVANFWKLKKAAENFKLMVLPSVDIIEDVEDGNYISVQELDGNNIEEEMIAIDQIIFNELKKPCDSELFKVNVLNYLSDDFPETEKQEFVNTIWMRIAHFISLKIVVAFSYALEETQIQES